MGSFAELLRHELLSVAPALRPSKCPKFYTTMISGEKGFTSKKSVNLVKIKIATYSLNFFKLYTKRHNLTKIPYTCLVNTLLKTRPGDLVMPDPIG